MRAAEWMRKVEEAKEKDAAEQVSEKMAEQVSEKMADQSR